MFFKRRPNCGHVNQLPNILAFIPDHNIAESSLHPAVIYSVTGIVVGLLTIGLISTAIIVAVTRRKKQMKFEAGRVAYFYC